MMRLREVNRETRAAYQALRVALKHGALPATVAREVVA